MSSERWTTALIVGLLSVQTLLLGVLLFRINGLYSLALHPGAGAPLAAVSDAVIDVDPGDGASLGPADAPVTLVEFSCFTCPHCADLQPTLHRLREEYGDRLRIAFRYFPLRTEGKPMLLAKAAECGRRQGRFWEVHDRLFVAARSIASEADLAAVLDDVGLDKQSFDACLASEQTERRVLDDFEAGRGYGVDSTPTVFVNGRRVQALALPTFERLIGEILKGAAS